MCRREHTLFFLYCSLKQVLSEWLTGVYVSMKSAIIYRQISCLSLWGAYNSFIAGERGAARVNIICIKKDLTCCMNLICCRDNIKSAWKVGDISFRWDIQRNLNSPVSASVEHDNKEKRLIWTPWPEVIYLVSQLVCSRCCLTLIFSVAF